MPIPAMAGVILLVAIRLVNPAEIRHILGTSPKKTAIAAVTFGAALLIDLEFATYAGVLLSLALFLKKTSRPFAGIGAPDPDTPTRMFKNAAESNLAECPQLLISRLDGPLYFGSVEHVRRLFRRFQIDMPGADLLIEEAARRHRYGGSFHLQTKTPRAISKLARFKVMKALPRERVHLSKRDAIAEVFPLLDRQVCATCPVRIFAECPRAGEVAE